MEHHQDTDQRREWAIASVLIFVISAFSYLLLARQFGFYNDDWYLVYAGKVEGLAKFHDVFAGDRPFRAYFVGFVYNLFGLNVPLYSYLSYALRAAGGLAMFWLLRLLWPKQGWLNTALAVMFVVYPGWMDQPDAFDYQSHLLSFALMVFSIALTVRAIYARKVRVKAGLAGMAVLTQVISLLLMEYYIGLEGLRLVLILYVLSGRSLFWFYQAGWIRRLGNALLTWLPYLAGAAGFMVWRTVFFQETRSATDLGGIFSSLTESPLNRGLWIITYLFQDFLNTTLIAWFLPLYERAFNLRLSHALAGIGVGVLSAGLMLAGIAWLRRASRKPPAEEHCAKDGIDMVWIGALGVIFGLIPILLGNRHVIFPDYSRFTLPASVGVILFIGGLLAAFTARPLRIALPVFLVGLSVIMHYSNSIHYAENWQVMRNFWWQVSWRAPQITPKTVLVAQYASVGIPEDYIVWGPANLIYYPEENRVDEQTVTPLNSAVLTPQVVLDIELGLGKNDRERRGITSNQDFGQTLVLTMPVKGACVRAIDGLAPELSENELDRVYRIAPRSKVQYILTEGDAPTLPAELFGPEPPEGWCTYYEKASLARQKGDWQAIVQLSDEARALKLTPNEWVEWMPFAQAYAYTGRYEEIDHIAVIYTEKPFLKSQACQIFTEDVYGYGTQYPEGQGYLKEKFCNH